MITSAVLAAPRSEGRSIHQVAPYLVTAVVHLASSIPGLTPLYLVFSMAGFIYWTHKKRDELALLVLLLGSSFSYTSLSIWNNGVIPGLPFLMLGLSLIMVGVRITVAKAIGAALCAIGLFTLSVSNVFEVGISPVVIDLLVVASIPLAALRFRNLSEHQFFLVLSACALITLTKTVIFAFASIKNPVLSTYTNEIFLDTLDELTGFNLLFALMLMSTSNSLRWLTIYLFGALVFHYAFSDNWLGYYGVGSQVLLALIFFIISLLFRFPVAFFALAGMMIFFIPLLSISSDGAGDLKLQQLLSVFDILLGSNIDLLPHSVRVRVAEITTFFDSAWWQQLFGGGLGGYINLSGDFPTYLGPDDYPDKQVESGKITTPHNLGYLMVKFGYVGLVLAMLFLIWIYRPARKMGALKFATYMTFGVFLILNLGYTLKISVMLGLLWVVVRDCYRRERLGIQSEYMKENGT